MQTVGTAYAQIEIDPSQLRELTEEEQTALLEHDQVRLAEVYKDLHEVCELFEVTREMLIEQGIKIDEAASNVERAEYSIEVAVVHLEQATEHVRKGALVKVLAVVGGVFGGTLGLTGLLGGPALAAITVPAGIAGGASLGGGLGLAGERKLAQRTEQTEQPESPALKKIRKVVLRIFPTEKRV